MEKFELSILDPKDKEESVQKHKEKWKKDSEKYTQDVNSIGEYLSHIVRDGETYTETYKLNDEGDIDSSTLSNNSGRNILEMIKDWDVEEISLEIILEDVVNKFTGLKHSLAKKDGNLVLTVSKV